MIDYRSNKCITDPDYVVPCGANQVFVRSRNQCECLDGYYYSSATGGCSVISCKSSEKWSWKWIRCIPISCPKLMSWNDREGACECIEDYFFSNKQQRCVPAFCDDGFKFSFRDEMCVRRGGGGGDNTKPTPPKPVEPSKPKPSKPIKCKSKRQQWFRSSNKCSCKKRYTKKAPAGYKGIYFSKSKCKLVRQKWCPYKKKCSSWIKRWNNKTCKCDTFF